MAYQLRFFHPDEFLPDGHEDISVMDERTLKLADDIRALLDVPCTINAGGRQYCGWRPNDCPIGAKASYHKTGKAIDLHPQGMSAEDARTIIRKAVSEGLLPDLGGVELGVNWLHADIRPRIGNKVLWFHA
jgi:uncharacterized protein YcbK (DUF882 family)